MGPQKILKRDTAREHKQIFEAAISRDAKAAVRALDSHYRTTAEQVVSVLSRIPKVVANAPKRVQSWQARVRAASPSRAGRRRLPVGSRSGYPLFVRWRNAAQPYRRPNRP